MKKALAALSAFALVMTLPLVGSAGTVTNTFLTSTSGTTSLSNSGTDTITYEVSLQSIAGNIYTGMQWSLSGDVAGALGDVIPWANTNNLVTGWTWAYSGGGGKVKFGTNGRLSPKDNSAITTLPTPVSIGYGWDGTIRTGDGSTSVVGTVTITANTSGVFDGGGFFLPNVDGFVSGGIDDGSIATAASFTVVPEPGTALLMVLGLGGLGIMGRKSRK